MIKHIKSLTSRPLHETLFEQLQLSREEVSHLLDLGAIYGDGKRLVCTQTEQVPAETVLRVHLRPKRFEPTLLKWPECRVFEDDSYLVINKPSGLPVHPTLDNQKENVLALLQIKSEQKLFITHRLDVGTSGLLVFAKTETAQKNFNDLLMNSKVRKIYKALVHGHGVVAGLWTHYMEPSDRAPRKVTMDSRPGWAPCRIQVLDVTEVDAHHSEVTIQLLTGRTHQIRVQLSFAGHPIVGDQMYGSPILLTPVHIEQISLHCSSLNWEDNGGLLTSLKAPEPIWS